MFKNKIDILYNKFSKINYNKITHKIIIHSNIKIINNKSQNKIKVFNSSKINNKMNKEINCKKIISKINNSLVFNNHKIIK